MSFNPPKGRYHKSKDLVGSYSPLSLISYLNRSLGKVVTDNIGQWDNPIDKLKNSITTK